MSWECVRCRYHCYLGCFPMLACFRMIWTNIRILKICSSFHTSQQKLVAALSWSSPEFIIPFLPSQALAARLVAQTNQETSPPPSQASQHLQERRSLEISGQHRVGNRFARAALSPRLPQMQRLKSLSPVLVPFPECGSGENLGARPPWCPDH